MTAPIFDPCPLGECDGSGLLVTVDFTHPGEDSGACPCVAATPMPPEVETRLIDAIHLYENGVSR